MVELLGDGVLSTGIPGKTYQSEIMFICIFFKHLKCMFKIRGKMVLGEGARAGEDFSPAFNP